MNQSGYSNNSLNNSQYPRGYEGGLYGLNVDQSELFENEESVRFFQLIQLLQRTALINLGFIPIDDKEIYNLEEAKEAIELLKVIEKKTSNNLSEIESKLLKGTLSELQFAFVKAPENQETKQKEKEESATIKQSFEDPSKAPSEVVFEEE